MLPTLTGHDLPHPGHAGDPITEAPKLCFIREVPWVFPNSDKLATQLAVRATAIAVLGKARCLLWGGGPLKAPPGYKVPFPLELVDRTACSHLLSNIASQAASG